MNNNIDKEKLFLMLKAASGGKLNENAVKKAQNGDISELISALPKSEKEKLLSALKNKNAAQEILNGKKAQEILRSLKKEKRDNGRT